MCDQWLDYDTEESRVDRVLDAQKDVTSYAEMVTYTAVEHHIWFSVFMRPMRSNFTRIQRLSCLLGLIYLTMIICTMTIKTPDDNTTMSQITIGPFRFSKENFEAAIVSVSVSTGIIWLVIFFFKNAHNDGKDSFDNKLLRVYRKANNKFHLDSSVVGRHFVPPAAATMRHQFYFLPHFVIYVGWTILILAVSVATYFVIEFSDDWAVVKSDIWMTSIFVAILCSFLITEALKVNILIFK